MFKDKQGDTISVEPRLRIARPPSTASEAVSKLHLPVTKHKVEPAPDKVKVIEEGADNSNEAGVENKEYLEMESLTSSTKK